MRQQFSRNIVSLARVLIFGFCVVLQLYMLLYKYVVVGTCGDLEQSENNKNRRCGCR